MFISLEDGNIREARASQMKSAGEPKGSAANNDDRVGLGDSHCKMRWGTSTRWSSCSISIVTQLTIHESTASIPTPGSSAGAAEKWTIGRVPDVPKWAF